MGSTILEQLGPEPRIAVLRTGGIGDFLSLTPALRSLHRAAPRAHIVLLTRASNVELARRYPYIKEVLPVPPYPGLLEGPADRAGLERLLEELRTRGLDLALQCNGNGRLSNHVVLRMGARLTVGYRAPDAPDLDLWLPYDDLQHEVLRYLDLVALLGAPADGLHLELPLLPSDFDELDRLASDVGWAAGREGRFACLNPTSAAASRRWPAERFAAVADALVEEFGLSPVVLVGGPGQEWQAEAVARAMRHSQKVVTLAGKTTLGSLAALLSLCRLLITNDTGPGHMAEALGTPSVVVYGSSHPFKWGPIVRTWHRPVAVYDVPCRWMPQDGCRDEQAVPCLQAVGVEQVLREARDLLHMLEQLESRQARVRH